MGDAGFSCVSYEDDKALTCTGGFGLERSLMAVEDFTTESLALYGGECVYKLCVL